MTASPNRPATGGRGAQGRRRQQVRPAHPPGQAGETAADVGRKRSRQPAPHLGNRSDHGRGKGGTKAEVVYGKHSVRAVFRARPEAIRRVVLREGAARYLQEFIDLANQVGVEPELLRSGEFLRLGDLSEDDKHQGVFLVVEPLKIYDEYDFGLLDEASVVIVLDQLSNPQNFGTIVRTAAFFGVDAVVWLKNRAVDVDPTVSRVAVGGTEFVKLFRVTNLARSLQLLKERGFWVYGFDERGGKTLAEVRFADKAVVIIGAEGEGMRHRTKVMCDELVRIPGGRPGLESLNAAVAAGIVLAEMFR